MIEEHVSDLIEGQNKLARNLGDKYFLINALKYTI